MTEWVLALKDFKALGKESSSSRGRTELQIVWYLLCYLTVVSDRVVMFFKEQNLMKSVREMLGPRARGMQRFDFSRNTNNRMNKTWVEVNNYIKVPRADKPDKRYEKIHTLLEALNLHKSGSLNEFLNVFGIKVAVAPKEVDGIRRVAPGIVFGHQCEPAIDGFKYNWRQDRNTQYVNSASVERIIIIHSDNTYREPKELRAALEPMYRNRGIKYIRFEDVYIRRGRDEDMEKELEELFKKNKGSKSLLIT
ncbi:unnamed protein product [Cylicocyclus nassatus]|uniref:Uncharacterized protein n=1 Tax=Cylicocyclus nassatus TaxID=53992 RepID=A0AA36MFP6_CYLNA|nr:unnamed protein product [Cylicocyclus nassatus]